MKLFLPLLLSLTTLPLAAQTIQWSGLLDARAVLANSEHRWTDSGLGKARYDKNGLHLGQGILAGELALTNSLSANLVLNAIDDRKGVVDLQEAWVAWTPLPMGPWKLSAKAGAFFPTISEEVEYDRTDWTPTRTISASAINSWIGEEFRTKGLEFTLQHLGRDSGSPHRYGATLALYKWNDPAGTLLSWRGWGIGDRITGLSESLILADLPVYRATGILVKQSRDVREFRELDDRVGYYVGLNYGYANTLELSAMHYDNRADARVVKQGQYGWTTRFDHLGAKLKLSGDWELFGQVMQGSTFMGIRGVYIDYRAWYALASHPLGSGLLSVRYDQFRSREEDIIPSDPNNEHGHGLAIAYRYPLGAGLSWITEWLTVNSSRAARPLVGDLPKQTERSLSTSIRWQF